MKMFTKLIGPMLMLLLMSAIVVGQSQQVSNTIADKQTTEGILTDQMAGPLASALEQKSIDGTDAVSGWVLGSVANGYSQNSRAANNFWKYQRTVYLLTAAEVATAGITAGELLNSIGWWNLYAGNGTLAGNLNVYILNTADVAFNPSYTTWTNVTGAFTPVSALTSWTVPAEEGPWNVPFTSGTYNYTGGGLYIAWQFESPAGTVGTYPIAHYTYSLVSGLLYGTRSQTSTYPAMAGSAFRPITYLSSYTTVADIVKVTNIYAEEINAHPYAVPSPIKVQVFNVSGASATFDVILTGTDGYNQTVNVTVAANTGQTVTFPNWSPAVDGDYTFTATTSAIAGEGFTENNSYYIDVNVNTSEVSYSYYLGPYSYGFTTPGFGIFAEKHHMNGAGIVTGAVLGISSSTTATGNTVYGVVLDAAGVIVATSPAHVILASELNTAIAVNFATPPVFTNADYYVGMLTTAGTGQWYPLMAQTENPIRPNGFFTFASTGGTPNPATWRFILGALVAPYVPCSPPTNLYASNITATNTTLNWTSGSGTSEYQWGLTGFTPATSGTVGSSGVVIPTTPNTGYDFYVRDVCTGPIYSPWVLKTYWTFCEDCPGGATAEGEGQLPNGSTGAGINGGCAVADPLLTLPIALGQTYCGESNTFLNDLGANARDNDYYYLDLNTPANIYWNITITLKGNGLYNVTFFDAGAMDCAIGAVAAVATTTGCQTATINVDVPSGNYYVVARVATAAGNLWPVGSGPWKYVLTVNGTQLGAPNIVPDPPATITMTVPPGGSTTQNLSVGNDGTYPLDYSMVTSGTFNPSWQEQFDTYFAGVQLAGQGAGNGWTTWSNLPGSVEDPFVSTEQAYTGANSVKIEGVNDAVHLFGNLTTGSYKISNRMYIVSGYVGYFNTLLTFAAPLYEWGMQVAFETSGTATIDAGTFAAATFPFSFDTWNLNEVYVDLDNDYAEYWFNGTFIWSWQWSVGTGGYSTNQLAANNFFAYTGAGGTDFSRYYVDDYRLDVAGNDWLTINGGLGASGTINVGAPAININLGFDAGSKPLGTYTKTINVLTNELSGPSSYTITVNMIVGYALTGHVYYGPANLKPMTSIGTITQVICTPGPTVTTGAGGTYDIRPLAGGGATYLLTGFTDKPGTTTQITGADYIIVNRMAAGLGTPYTNLQYRAGDVNKTNSVTASDAILIKRRAAGLASAWAAPVFVFDGPFPATPALGGLPVTIFGADVIQDFRTLLSGDMNGSFTPAP